MFKRRKIKKLQRIINSCGKTETNRPCYDMKCGYFIPIINGVNKGYCRKMIDKKLDKKKYKKDAKFWGEKIYNIYKSHSNMDIICKSFYMPLDYTTFGFNMDFVNEYLRKKYGFYIFITKESIDEIVFVFMFN